MVFTYALSMVFWRVVGSVVISFVNNRFHNHLLCTVFSAGTPSITHLHLQQLNVCSISVIWNPYSLNWNCSAPLYLSCCSAFVHQKQIRKQVISPSFHSCNTRQMASQVVQPIRSWLLRIGLWTLRDRDKYYRQLKWDFHVLSNIDIER
jgi:hypothetical protein